MTHRIGLAILHLGHEVRWYRPSLAPHLEQHPAVLRASVRRVVWRRGAPMVWS